MNIIINQKKRAIEVSKTFAKAASKFRSDEYEELRAARMENPNFTVVVLPSRKKKSSFKGLTYDYMKSYIESHDTEDKSIITEFKALRGDTDTAEGTLAESYSYKEIKEWFLKKYPTIKEFMENRDKILTTNNN